MQSLIEVAKALSDPNRVKIIKMLQQRTMCVCELRVALGISQPAVSKHLKLLEKAGLVSSYKDGAWTNYVLSDAKSSPFAATLLGNLKHWLAHDPEVSDLLRRIQTIRREEVCR